jgi:hypothetical protein
MPAAGAALSPAGVLQRGAIRTPPLQAHCMTTPPAPLPSRPPIRGREVANTSPITPVRLLLGMFGLLAVAWFIGGKPREARSAEDAAATASAPVIAVAPTAAPPQATVLRGVKPTAHRTVDEARMTLLEGGKVLRIDGGVGHQFARDLAGFLAENRSLQRIDITSGGGYTLVGFEAARLINRNNLVVRVKSHCASICVALWAAAFSRQLEPDAVIGLHQWTAQCEVMASPERERCQHDAQFATDNKTLYEAWLRSAGFDAFLLALQARTPPEDIAILNAGQLRSHGVGFVLVDKAD